MLDVNNMLLFGDISYHLVNKNMFLKTVQTVFMISEDTEYITLI